MREGRIIKNSHKAQMTENANPTHSPSILETLAWRKGATEVETSHSSDESHASEVADVRQKMQDALSKVISESGLAINPDEWGQWRPTKRVRGTLHGVVEAVTCIATNGILAIYVFDFGQAHPSLGVAFKGHVAHFEYSDGEKLKVGSPPPLFSVTSQATGGKKKKPSSASAADVGASGSNPRQYSSGPKSAAGRRAKAMRLLKELGL